MAKLQIHGILSDLHKLLASYRAPDFVAASEHPGVSPRLREALQALAREADSEQRTDPTRSPNRERVLRPRNSHAELGHPKAGGGNVLEAVRQSPHYESSRGLVMYARSMGLRLEANPKDSRERLARRLAALIEKMPAEKKDEAVANLLLGRSTQTQGWIDVIKSSNQ